MALWKISGVPGSVLKNCLCPWLRGGKYYSQGGQSMSQVITKRSRMSRRRFLKGLALSQAPIIVGLPPLVSMFNSNGMAYAAENWGTAKTTDPIERRFVFWFNGNGIPERYWIPSR